MAALLGRAAGLGLAAVTGGRRLLRCGTGTGTGTGSLLHGTAPEHCLSRGISSDQRPKRPLTAYLRFVMDNRTAFREKNPEASNVELVKKLAGAWKELPASQKQVYEEARKTDWKKYGEQMAAFKAQLTPAQAAALKEERRKQLAKRRSIRAKRSMAPQGIQLAYLIPKQMVIYSTQAPVGMSGLEKTGSELNLLGKPKRARSGFNIFVSENFQESEGMSAVAKLKKLFDTWQKLTPSQKQPYLQLAEDDKVRYENEMKSWEAKMIELGREDLVRSRKQRLKKKPAETAKQAETAKASSGRNKAKLKKSEE